MSSDLDLFEGQICILYFVIAYILYVIVINF